MSSDPEDDDLLDRIRVLVEKEDLDVSARVDGIRLLFDEDGFEDWGELGGEFEELPETRCRTCGVILTTEERGGPGWMGFVSWFTECYRCQR